jgi:hypothetical protein
MELIKRVFGPVQDRIPSNPQTIHINGEWIGGLEEDPEVALQRQDDEEYERWLSDVE